MSENAEKYENLAKKISNKTISPIAGVMEFLKSFFGQDQVSKRLLDAVQNPHDKALDILDNKKK